MKIALLLSLLPFLSSAQADTIRLVKAYNYHPMIANVQLGEIPYWKLCDLRGLSTHEECSILSFDISYFGKNGWSETHITGRQIPDSICVEIGVYGLNNMVFFTNIRAMSHENYKVILLSPMNLTPIKSDD